jgi:hypothetical protein
MSPAKLVTAGDIDGDGIDDLIGTWSRGLWVRYGSTGSWIQICTPIPSHIAAGDMNGDGRDDVLGTWPSGVYYMDSASESWHQMSISPASLVAAGDLDSDGIADLVGVWSTGLWVKNSTTSSWEKITSNLPTDIDTGLYRKGAWNTVRTVRGTVVRGQATLSY